MNYNHCVDPNVNYISTKVIPLNVFRITKNDGTGGPTIQEFYDAIDDLLDAFLEHQIIFIIKCRLDVPCSSCFNDSGEIGSLFPIYNSDKGINLYIHNFGGGAVNSTPNATAHGDFRGNAEVLIHEIGHAFGLHHTFKGGNQAPCCNNGGVEERVDGSNACDAGDFVTDTPACPGRINLFASYPRVTGESPNIPFCTVLNNEGFTDTQGDAFTDSDLAILTKNHMSYADASCRTEFTPEQVQRMHWIIGDFHNYPNALPLNNIITSNTTWTTNREFEDDIIIKSPATLTIKSTVKMAWNTKIHVENGARLIVDNGTLTVLDTYPENDNCDNSLRIGFWRGIYNEGRVDTKNNTVIEKAVNAIYASDQYSSEKTYCYSTLFRNNLNSYTGINGSGISFFKDCDFVLNSDFSLAIGPLGAYEGAQVEVIGKNLNIFRGCTFVNEVVEQTFSTFAIKAYNSDLSFQKYSYQTPNEIKNWHIGIYLSNIASYAYVYFTDFEGCRDAIYADNVDLTAKSNDFIIDNPSNINFLIRNGMTLLNSNEYTVKNNVFSHSLSQNVTGITIHNSNTANNVVEENTFSKMRTALSISGNNGDNQMNGLKFLCNDYSNMQAYDNRIYGNASVNRFFGTDANPSGNKFSHVGGNSDVYNQGSTAIKYIYSIQDTREEPLYYQGISPTSSFKFSCQNNPEGGGGPTGGGSFRIAELTQLKASIQAEREVYAALIDNGATQTYLSRLQYRMSKKQIKELFNEFQKMSPYISIDLMAGILSSGLFNVKELVSLLENNPDVLSDHNISESISKNSAFDDSIKKLEELRVIETERTITERRISGMETEWLRAYRNMLEESRSEEKYSESDYREDLAIKDNLYGDIQIIESYLNERDYAQTRASMNTFSSKYSENENELFTALRNLNDLLISVYKEGRYEATFTENEIDQVLTIALKYQGYASTKAQNLLSYFYGYEFEDESIEKRNTKILSTTDRTRVTLVQNAVIYPNPAKDIINLELNNLDENTVFTLYDRLGRTLYKETIIDNISTISIDDLPKGIIFYTLNVGGVPQTGKFVKF